MKSFLLEIGCEELPARFIKPAKEGISKFLDEALKAQRIGHSEIRVMGTPRRLAVLIDEIEEKQAETVTVKFGPPAARAYDESGNPLPAAIGFAKSQGVDVGELKVRVKENAELIAVEKKELGRETKDVLAQILPDIVTRIPFQKKMKWGAGTLEFGRPLHWVVALLDNEVVPFEIGGIATGNVSMGHRFLSPGEVIIPDEARYVSTMRSNYIVVDETERLSIMNDAIRRIEQETGAKAVIDPRLLEEIQYITEYPYGLLGTFEEKYLELPRAVIVNVMEGHQRYIPLEKEDGTLLAGFIFFANTAPVATKEVIRGNERVLRARLADGQFFFDEDRKMSLDSLYDRLDAVMFHKKLGSLKAKTLRVEKIADNIASQINLPVEGKIARTARLFKADLLTHMVGEFPELQGLMGKIYAGHQGEDPEVAKAIEEHYFPIGTDGAVAESDLGALMALADKIDSLVAFFSVGISPTGNLDPFALRRQALGAIRTVISKKYHIDLQRTFLIGYDAVDAQGKVSHEACFATLSEFISTRFKFLMIEEGHNQEFVNAILPSVPIDIFDGYSRLTALETQSSIEDFRRLMVGFKRVYNIAKSITEERTVNESLLGQDEERALYSLFKAKKDLFVDAVRARQYDNAITILVGFKETVDAFFDKVFVMVEDERVKENRLSLLANVKNMFLSYGDFSKIRVEELK
jgi:glycyl-tRNA synthetase beta chain